MGWDQVTARNTQTLWPPEVVSNNFSAMARPYGGKKPLPLVDVGRLFRLRYFLPPLLRDGGTPEGDRGFGEGVLQQAPEGAKPVFPADFLAFGVGASPIADAHFVDAELALGHLDRNFWLEAKPVLLEGNRLNDLTPERLVAGLHVTQVDVGEAIGKQSKQSVSHRVPEVQYAVLPAAQESR